MIRPLLFFGFLVPFSNATPPPIALYEFKGTDESTVQDSSGTQPPANLEIADPRLVRRETDGLRVLGSTLIRTKTPPSRILSTLKRSREFTVSAWVTPSNLTQAGPARIFTISKDSSNRNFTLAQDKDRFDVRLRFTKTDANGLPSMPSPAHSLKSKQTHVVFSRAKSGEATLYIDGRKKAQRKGAGTFDNWNGAYLLALGNEISRERPWLGTYHQVALYPSALSQSEIENLFKKGPVSAPKKTPEELSAERSKDLFVNQIEPIIARHCLECHDSTTAEGDLDLSHRKTALADPEIISPGHLEESLLWESIESDEMPEDRDPLSAEEKKLVREWIATGAKWPRPHLDPAAHTLDTDPRDFPRRLTVQEYIETVKATTGIEIEKEARTLLPKDLRADGFTNTAYNLGVDFKHVEAHARLAEIIVGRMDVSSFAAKFSKNRSLTQKPIRKHIETMGLSILRAPLSSREVDLYQGLATTASATGGDFEAAMKLIIQAMLQSPRFIYRIESGSTPDAYDLANRLSYFVTGGPPDQKLLEAAANGRLYDPEELKRQAQRLLKKPQAIEQSLSFLSEWLHLDRLSNMQPGKDKYPDWDPQLADDMRQETLAFARHLLWDEQRPLSHLLKAQVTFVTPRLASHYGLEVPDEAEAGSLQRIELSENPTRGGLLTQGSLLTIGGDDASMVTRGLFVLHDLLRGSVKDPPPGVDTTPIPSAPGQSQRVFAEQRLRDQSCGGCHAKFEPLAYALERYDGIARYSTHDTFKNALRQDGEIHIPGTPSTQSYKTTGELMDLLADSPRVQETLTWKLAQFALGRPIATKDRVHLEQIHQPNLTYQDLIIRIALSPLLTQ